MGSSSIPLNPATTAADHAITILGEKRRDNDMTDEDLIAYVAVMALADKLLKNHIIEKKDFYLLEKAMMKKYHLPPNSIFRDYRIVSNGLPRGLPYPNS